MCCGLFLRLACALRIPCVLLGSVALQRVHDCFVFCVLLFDPAEVCAVIGGHHPLQARGQQRIRTTSTRLSFQSAQAAIDSAGHQSTVRD